MSQIPELQFIQPTGDDHEDFRRTAALAVRKGHELASLLAGMATYAHLEQEEAVCFAKWSDWMRSWLDNMFPPEEDFGGDNVIRFPHEKVG